MRKTLGGVDIGDLDRSKTNAANLEGGRCMAAEVPRARWQHIFGPEPLDETEYQRANEAVR